MVELNQICKYYGQDQKKVTALDHVSLKVAKGEFLVVRGPSGSGKSTLLLTIGGMLHPSSGQIIFDGRDLYALPHKDLAKFRAKNVGFIFQLFHLLPYLNTAENILLPAAVEDSKDSRSRAAELIGQFGLSKRTKHKPSELSVGERQRTAIGRALINNPKIILADEPTGNLDPDNASQVIDYLKAFQRNGGTVILVTHGHTADGSADRMLSLREGHIEDL